MPGYLDKNDPLAVTIRGRAITDLKLSADPESPANRVIAPKIEILTQEEKARLEAIVVQFINDYTMQTRFDGGTLMRHFRALGEMDRQELAKEYDIRVQHLRGNKYGAELWEDGLAVNSEAHALKTAQEMVGSHPDDKEIGDEVKEKYANARKAIHTGKQERYVKVMVLLYTLEHDGSTTYHDPFQSVIDFVKQPAASGREIKQ